MTWVKVDDKFPDHPKAVSLSDGAVACWLRGLCYSSRHELDGDLPTGALRLLGTTKTAGELVAAGLWEATDVGWTIHDYTVHQRTREEIDEMRATKVAASSKGNHKRWHRDRQIVVPDCRWCIAEQSQTGSQVGSQNGPKASPEVDTEVDNPPNPPVDDVAGPEHYRMDETTQQQGREHLQQVRASLRPLAAVPKEAS